MAKKVTRRPARGAAGPGARTTRAGRPSRPTGKAPRVRVRMYRQGLGDCFLITFDAGGRERHMMIDCGSLGAKTTGVKIETVVADIANVTKGHLDVLVVTHEHKDHVSGFNSQRAEFAALKIDRVWLAWTEDPHDPLAKQIAKRKEDLAMALVHAARALKAKGTPESTAASLTVHDLLGFAGEPDALGASEFAETINAAMSFVRTDLSEDVTFWRPGRVIEEPWLPGFRIYVLGPPRDAGALEDTGENAGADLFSLTDGLRCGAAFNASGRSAAEYEAAIDREERDDFVASQPFDRRFGLERERFERQHDLASAYLGEDQSWRRVDGEWLNIASDLALQLDSATNNTSLALAIERIADGKLLLFPADAQQGNWLSWHAGDLEWVAARDSSPRKVSMKDLLARTVFYKAGHHASHNGTMRAHGLEMMKRERDLTTFIPLDRAVALGRHPQGSWRMPAAGLYRALLEKCQGRVVRSDLGWADDAANANDKTVEKELRGIATADEWRSWKQSQKAAKHVTVTPLFVDYMLD